MLSRILSAILSIIMLLSGVPLNEELADKLVTDTKAAYTTVSDGISDTVDSGISKLSDLFKKIAQYISSLDTKDEKAEDLPLQTQVVSNYLFYPADTYHPTTSYPVEVSSTQTFKESSKTGNLDQSSGTNYYRVVSGGYNVDPDAAKNMDGGTIYYDLDGQTAVWGGNHDEYLRLAGTVYFCGKSSESVPLTANTIGASAVAGTFQKTAKKRFVGLYTRNAKLFVYNCNFVLDRINTSDTPYSVFGADITAGSSRTSGGEIHLNHATVENKQSEYGIAFTYNYGSLYAVNSIIEGGFNSGVCNTFTETTLKFDSCTVEGGTYGIQTNAGIDDYRGNMICTGGTAGIYLSSSSSLINVGGALTATTATTVRTSSTTTPIQFGTGWQSSYGDPSKYFTYYNTSKGYTAYADASGNLFFGVPPEYTATISHWCFGLKTGDGTNGAGNAVKLATTTKKFSGGNVSFSRDDFISPLPNGVKVQYDGIATGAFASDWTSYPFTSSTCSFSGIYKDVSIQMNYAPIDYTITYDYNGGTAPTTDNPTSYNVVYGASFTNEPTRAGYKFDGWTIGTDTTKVTGVNHQTSLIKGTDIVDNATADITASDFYQALQGRTTGDITVKANWVHVHTMHYNAGGMKCCCGNDTDEITFEPWSDAKVFPVPKSNEKLYYYLTTDINSTAASLTFLGDLYLCLNGHSITTSAFINTNGHTLKICNCQAYEKTDGDIKNLDSSSSSIKCTVGQVIYQGTAAGHIYLYNLNVEGDNKNGNAAICNNISGATLDVHNSKLCCDSTSSHFGYGINNQAKADVNVYSSTVIGTAATAGAANRGAGIYNDGAGSICVNESTIIGESKDTGTNSSGYGIYNVSDGAVTVNNSTVTGTSSGTGSGSGAGIYNASSGAVTVNGSKIYGNNTAASIKAVDRDGMGAGIAAFGTGTINVKNSTVKGYSKGARVKGTASPSNDYVRGVGAGILSKSNQVIIDSSTVKGEAVKNSDSDTLNTNGSGAGIVFLTGCKSVSILGETTEISGTSQTSVSDPDDHKGPGAGMYVLANNHIKFAEVSFTKKISVYTNSNTNTSNNKQFCDGGWPTDKTPADYFTSARTDSFNGVRNGSSEPYKGCLYLYKATTCTVTFDLNGHGGTAPESQDVIPGTTATEPTAPTDADYRFTGWYSNPACTSPFSFTTAITKETVLYAGWEKAGCTLNVNVADGSFTVKIGTAEPFSVTDANYDEIYKVGTKVVITAVPESNGYFLYWYDVKTMKIVSDSASYSFDLGENVYLEGVCSNSGESIYTYYDPIDKSIIQHGKSDTVTAPDNVRYHNGYIFDNKWEEKELNENGDMLFSAVYKADKKNTFTVTLFGAGTLALGKPAGKMTTESNSTTGEAYFDSKIIVSIADNEIPSGKEFVGWALDGSDDIISYSKVYVFYAYRDVTIKAVFGDAEAAKPVLQMTAHTDKRVDMETPVAGSFTITRTVPTDDYIYVTSGILVTNTKGSMTDDAFYDYMMLENVKNSGGNIVQKKAAYSTANGQYLLNINALPGKIYYARGYLTVCDISTGKYKVVYTDITKLTMGSNLKTSGEIITNPDK